MIERTETALLEQIIEEGREADDDLTQWVISADRWLAALP